MPQKKPAKSYQHDLHGWFSRFAANLKEMPGGNPMTHLMDADAEINPYFVTFGLYWYRVPGRTAAERGHRLAEAALNRLSKLPSRLREDADDIRWILTTKFPPPWGGTTPGIDREGPAHWFGGGL